MIDYRTLPDEETLRQIIVDHLRSVNSFFKGDSSDFFIAWAADNVSNRIFWIANIGSFYNNNIYFQISASQYGLTITEYKMLSRINKEEN